MLNYMNSMFVPSTIYAVIIFVLNLIFRKIAYALNDWGKFASRPEFHLNPLKLFFYVVHYVVILSQNLNLTKIKFQPFSILAWDVNLLPMRWFFHQDQATNISF